MCERDYDFPGGEVAMEKLSPSDYQRILAVLRRDASLRCREQERIRRLRGAAEGVEAEEEEEEEEEADRKALALARERRLNARACVRCRRAFPRSSAILRCGRCRFRICGDCCVQGQAAAPGTCLCTTCHREVQLKSGDWFYTQLRKRFGGFGLQPEEGSFLRPNKNKALAEEVDPETGKVREFVERLVEALVSGGLDNVNINRLYSHPEYDCMFSKYHSSLCEALARLTIALQMSISNKPLPTDLVQVGRAEKDGVVAMVGEEDDDGLLCSPSVAHAQLKTLVQQVINEARELPRLGIQQPISNGMHTKQTEIGDVEMENNPIIGKASEAENEDFASKTYEDILATAILNKVILQCQRENEWGAVKESSGVDRNRNLLVDRVEVGVQAEVEEGCRMRGDGSGPEGASAEEFAEEDDDDNDNANFNSFGRWRNKARPFTYRIEEKVEEVMTTYASDDDENLGGRKHRGEDLEAERARTLSSSSSIDDDTSMSMMRGLALHHKGAPFPEFGVDIVDDDDGDNEGSGDEAFGDESSRNNPTTIKSGVDSWEENWLFQRRRLKMRGALSKGGYPLVPMLVPNPSEDLRARIGDVDAEEISDLSECNDSTEWDVHEDFTRSHHLSSSSASVASDSLSSEPDLILADASANFNYQCPVEATNHGLLDFAEAQNHQKDSEYTEDYAVAEQRRLAMTPSPMPLEGKDDLMISPINTLSSKPVPRPRTQIPSASRTSSHPLKYISPSNRRPPPSTSKMELFQAPESAVVYAGKAAHFTLDLWSHFPVEVWWFHEELLLEEDDNHRIFFTLSKSNRPSSAEYHLEIFNTDPQNSSGNYSVAAIDSCGNSIWQDFTLSVRSSRRADFSPEFIVEPSDVTVAQGGEVEFLIEVKGHPEPKVSFWKGASLLHSSPNGYAIERQGGGHWMLRINKIALIDGGKFVVEARNRVGVATATAEVQVVEIETESLPEESLVTDVEEEMRALSSLEESSSVLQNGLQYQAEELRATARRLSLLVSQLEDLEIHLHSMEAEFGSLHSELDLGGIDMTTYVTSPWSTPLSSVSSSPPSSFSTSSSQAISALEDSSLEQRKVHLQQLLSCLQKEVEEAEGSRDDLSECSPKIEGQADDKEASPPKPGTIAEREHRKWESAAPIPDNPYSPEKISERLRSLKLRRNAASRSRGSGSDTSIDFPEFHSESENSEMAIPTLTINCGGKDLNPKKYGRDYYINNTDPKRRVSHHSNDREKRKQPDRVQHSTIEKQDEDHEGRKKGMVQEAEVTQIQKSISKTEEWIQNDEPTESQVYRLDKQKANKVNSSVEHAEDNSNTMLDKECGPIEKQRVNGSEAHTDDKNLTNGSVNGDYFPRKVDHKVNQNNHQTVNTSTVKTQIPELNRNKAMLGICRGPMPAPNSLPLENSPSLPSVRQLALQFSAAATTGVTNKTPIARRKKSPKEVVIVKKNDGIESKLDPPLQVDEDAGIFRAELAFSTYTNEKMDSQNVPGVGIQHCPLAPLTLHAGTQSLPPELHELTQTTACVRPPDEHYEMRDVEIPACQPAIPTSNSNNVMLLPNSGFAYNAHDLNPMNKSVVPKPCNALTADGDKGDQSTCYRSKKHVQHGGTTTKRFSFPSVIAKEEFTANSHSQFDPVHKNNLSEIVAAQSSKTFTTQLSLPCATDYSPSHASNNFNEPLNAIYASNPQTVELPLETGGDVPKQRQSWEGDKSLPHSSQHFLVEERIIDVDKKANYEVNEDGRIFFGKELFQDNIKQDKNKGLFVKEFLLGKDTDEASSSAFVSSEMKREKESIFKEPKEIAACSKHAEFKPKDGSYQLENNLLQEDYNKNDVAKVCENNDPKEFKKEKDDTEVKNKERKINSNVNWEFIHLHIQARLGARSASGKSVLTELEENSKKGKKIRYPVHSLTARSISREFREGLRQNQQTPIGRPVTNTSEQTPVWTNTFDEQKQNDDIEDGVKQEPISLLLNLSSKENRSSRSLDGTFSDDCSETFNGTHSREGTPSSDSLIDETNGHLLKGVGGGIAFWERRSPLGAPANGSLKDA